MSNFTLTPTAGLSISGITPIDGPKSTDRVTGAFAPTTQISIDDRINNAFIVNASTTETAINLGKIVTGKALWIECDGPLYVTLEQDLGSGPVNVVMKVDRFLYLQSDFTALKIANPSATTAVNVNIIVGGDRLPVGGGAGIF